MSTKAKPNDFTGIEREKAIAKAQEEQQLRKDSLSMATQVEQNLIETTAIDVTTGQTVVIDDVESLPEVEVEDPSTKLVKVRIRSDLQTTYGAGKIYDFEAGKFYYVPKAFADHLEEKNQVWH